MRPWISIKKSADFKRITNSGRKYVSPAFVLFSIKNISLPNPCVGFTASRKVGNAVIRNRAKRRLRAAMDACVKSLNLQEIEIVLIARHQVVDVDFKELLRQLEKAITFVLRQEEKS